MVASGTDGFTRGSENHSPCALCHLSANRMHCRKAFCLLNWPQMGINWQNFEMNFFDGVLRCASPSGCQLSVRLVLVQYLVTWRRPKGFYCFIYFLTSQGKRASKGLALCLLVIWVTTKSDCSGFPKITSFVRVVGLVKLTTSLAMSSGACWRGGRKHARLPRLSDGSWWHQDSGSRLPWSAAPLAKRHGPAGESQISSINPKSSLRGHYSILRSKEPVANTQRVQSLFPLNWSLQHFQPQCGLWVRHECIM